MGANAFGIRVLPPGYREHPDFSAETARVKLSMRDEAPLTGGTPTGTPFGWRVMVIFFGAAFLVVAYCWMYFWWLPILGCIFGCVALPSLKVTLT